LPDGRQDDLTKLYFDSMGAPFGDAPRSMKRETGTNSVPPNWMVLIAAAGSAIEFTTLERLWLMSTGTDAR